MRCSSVAFPVGPVPLILGIMSPRCPVSDSGEFCGKCYEGVKGRAHHAGHAGQGRGWGHRRLLCMALKRIEKQTSLSASSGGCFELCEIATLYPTVMEFLRLERWEDGTSRRTGTITLLSDAGMLKAALNDRDADLSSFVAGRSLTALLEALEAGLRDGGLEWRKKAPWNPKGKGRTS